MNQYVAACSAVNSPARIGARNRSQVPCHGCPDVGASPIRMNQRTPRGRNHKKACVTLPVINSNSVNGAVCHSMVAAHAPVPRPSTRTASGRKVSALPSSTIATNTGWYAGTPNNFSTGTATSASTKLFPVCANVLPERMEHQVGERRVAEMLDAIGNPRKNHRAIQVDSIADDVSRVRQCSRDAPSAIGVGGPLEPHMGLRAFCVHAPHIQRRAKVVRDAGSDRPRQDTWNSGSR